MPILPAHGPGSGRKLIAALLVLLLAGIVTILWHALEWPPPRLLARYGFSEANGPTGRTWSSELQVNFVELERGYYRVYFPSWIDEWVERDRPLWICPSPVHPHLAQLLTDPESEEARRQQIPFWLSRGPGGTFRVATEEEVLLAASKGITDITYGHGVGDTVHLVWIPPDFDPEKE